MCLSTPLDCGDVQSGWGGKVELDKGEGQGQKRASIMDYTYCVWLHFSKHLTFALTCQCALLFSKLQMHLIVIFGSQIQFYHYK